MLINKHQYSASISVENDKGTVLQLAYTPQANANPIH